MKTGRIVRIVGNYSMVVVGIFSAILGVTEIIRDKEKFAEEDAAEEEAVEEIAPEMEEE